MYIKNSLPRKCINAYKISTMYDNVPWLPIPLNIYNSFKSENNVWRCSGYLLLIKFYPVLRTYRGQCRVCTFLNLYLTINNREKVCMKNLCLEMNLMNFTFTMFTLKLNINVPQIIKDCKNMYVNLDWILNQICDFM